MTVFSVDRVMAAPRPKATTFCGHVKMYYPRKYERYREEIAEAYRAAGGEHLGDAPVSVSIDIMRHLPDGRPKRVLSEPDTVKPDADNVAKAVLDALNGVAYKDDAQVVSLCVLKCDRVRGAQDRMRVSVEPWNEGEDE